MTFNCEHCQDQGFFFDDEEDWERDDFNNVVFKGANPCNYCNNCPQCGKGLSYEMVSIDLIGLVCFYCAWKEYD